MLPGREKLSLILLILVCVSACSSTQSDAGFAKQMGNYLANDANVAQLGGALEQHYKAKHDQDRKKVSRSEDPQLDKLFDNLAQVDPGLSPSRGNPNARIVIVEFSDFQCPFCSRGRDVMDQLLRDYKKDVRVVFKNFPLPFHSNARPAARAALAADRQGKFWEMHDELFDNQSRLGKDYYLELARKFNLNVEQFKKDMNDLVVDALIDADKRVADTLGVQGTPAYFINGVEVRGARPVAYFRQIIDLWLKRLGDNRVT